MDTSPLITPELNSRCKAFQVLSWEDMNRRNAEKRNNRRRRLTFKKNSINIEKGPKRNFLIQFSRLKM